MNQKEISEVAVRVRDINRVEDVAKRLRDILEPMTNKQGKPMFELHTWDQLTPFSNIIRMIDLLTLGVKAILIAVVLISVLNVMMMSVYERVREIGTLAAMGTQPRRIMGLFVAEGFSLGLVSGLAGAALGLGALFLLNLKGVETTMGQGNQVIALAPSVAPMEVVWACLTVLAVSVLASLQPAAKAARMDPVEALRHV